MLSGSTAIECKTNCYGELPIDLSVVSGTWCLGPWCCTGAAGFGRCGKSQGVFSFEEGTPRIVLLSVFGRKSKLWLEKSNLFTLRWIYIYIYIYQIASKTWFWPPKNQVLGGWTPSFFHDSMVSSTFFGYRCYIFKSWEFLRPRRRGRFSRAHRRTLCGLWATAAATFCRGAKGSARWEGAFWRCNEIFC